MKHLLFLLMLFCWDAISSEEFIKKCESLPEDVSIKDIFNTKDCYEISERIKKVTSFSEIILPRNRRTKEENSLTYPWTEDFPYLYGLNRKTMHDFYFYKPGFDSTSDILFKDLRLFKDFKNITHINYLPNYPYYKGHTGICNILKNSPSIKTIILNSNLLKNPYVDNCLSKSKIDGVIIKNQFKGFKKFLPKTKVIGIEYYNGELENLANFRDLKFIGISNNATTIDGLESLYGLTELTHISLNLKNNISDLNKLRLVINLTYLNVTCVNKEKENSPYTTTCSNRSNLSDISFVSNLRWLEHLNLSHHSISDISPISHLKELRSLKLRGNLISNLTNLNSLPKLKYLDLSGNKLKTTKGISSFSNLYFLNLSGNKLIDLEDVQQLDSLKYFNLSNNPKRVINVDFTLKSLRVLNLNGGGGNPAMDSFSRGVLNNLFNAYKVEEKLLIETLFHDFTLSPSEAYEAKCVTQPSIFDSQTFYSFPNLEILSLKNNQLEAIPSLAGMKKLRYLNLNRNKLTNLDTDNLPTNIESIQLEHNSIVNFPDFSRLNNLKQLNLYFNDITNISNITTASEKLFELDLSSNLIDDVSLLTSNFGYSNYMSYQSSIQISQNPVVKNSTNCPTGNSNFINKTCQDYLDGKSGALMPPRKVEGLSVNLIRNENKCSITFLDFEPRKRSFSLSEIDIFEN